MPSSQWPVASGQAARRTRAADRAAGLGTIPAEALRFDAGPFAFAAGEAKEGKRPITMLARTAQPIEHWYWGKVVHDMQGMQLAAPTLPIDYCHDPEVILGYLDQFDVGPEGLTVSGQVVSFQADDRAAEICHKADAGVPYQASIAFDPGTVICEDVREGMQVSVNGYQLQGPALVIRQWKLRAVSVCPYGADSDTRTSLAAAGRDIAVQFVSPTKDPSQMGAETKPAAPETKPAAQPATELKAETKPAASETPAADPRAEFKAALVKFTAAFGPANGAAWAAEGLSYEQALEKHVAELAASNKKLGEEKAELQTKLAAVPRGEAAPVSFGTTDKHEGGTAKPTAHGKFAGLGKLAAFAENLKLPAGKG